MKRLKILIIAIQFILLQSSQTFASTDSIPSIIILGIAQDAGYPQAGCHESCCDSAWANPAKKRFATSLALIDPKTKKWWLFEATPDIKEQLHLFENLTNAEYPFLPEGIFLTHGHMGHYTGLIQLGREALNAKTVKVYTMPRMFSYLSENGPWSQLVKLQNIALIPISENEKIKLSDNLFVSSFLVPHRDEFTETVGFTISSNTKSAIFIPDIDKWEKFNTDINSLIKSTDMALLDATFYRDGEIKGRAMSEVPHPFVEESMNRFSTLNRLDKKKIHFIHFNHSNPLLQTSSDAFKTVFEKGFQMAGQGQKIILK